VKRVRKQLDRLRADARSFRGSNPRRHRLSCMRYRMRSNFARYDFLICYSQ
jgi:hypothetical protein